MGLYSDAFRAECEKGVIAPGRPEIHPLLTLALPSGTRRFSNTGLASTALGGGQPRVQFGSVRRVIDLQSPTLGTVELQPKLSDIPEEGTTLRVFATEVARYPRSLRGVAAHAHLVSPNVPDVGKFTAFAGVLDAWAQTAPMSWALKLRPDDFALQYGSLPKASITPPDWPNADPAVYGTFVPIIYGIHNSIGITAKGMVPAYCVNRSNFIYLVALGTIKAITSVYADGVVVSTSNWARADATVSGTRVTLIDFTSDQGDAVITADVEGLTDNFTGAGDLISNPAYQLLHLMRNFFWGDWRSGPYLTDAPLHTGSFDTAAAFLADKGHEGSRWIGGSQQTRAFQELEAWRTSHGLQCFYTNSALLALAVNDHRTVNIYPGAPLFKAEEDEDGDQQLATSYDSQSLLRELIVQYVFGAAANTYHQATRVQDLTVLDRVSRNLQLPWSAARVL